MKKLKFTKFNLVIIVIFLVCAAGLKIWQYHWPDELLMLGDEPVLVQIAKTPYHHKKGLGGKEDLGKYDGMLFIFNGHRKIGIVMRGMNFPIDIVWLDKGTVVDMAPNVQVQPDVEEADLIPYYPRVEANLVLELPAGWVSEHDLKIGDELTIPN